MKRGEIWLADLGYAGKLRPVLVVSVDYTDDERAIVTYVPRTTRKWDRSRFDVPHSARGLKAGSFAVQLIGSISNAHYLRKISQVDHTTLEKVEVALRAWLGLEEQP